MGFLDPGDVVQAFMGGDNNFVHNIMSDCFHAGLFSSKLSLLLKRLKPKNTQIYFHFHR